MPIPAATEVSGVIWFFLPDSQVGDGNILYLSNWVVDADARNDT